MQINNINSQNFTAKKFRIPIKSTTLNKRGIGKQTKFLVQEYSNPKAKELWNEALNEKDITKKLDLLNAMGEYKIVDINCNKNLQALMQI